MVQFGDHIYNYGNMFVSYEQRRSPCQLSIRLMSLLTKQFIACWLSSSGTPKDCKYLMIFSYTKRYPLCHL